MHACGAGIPAAVRDALDEIAMLHCAQHRQVESLYLKNERNTPFIWSCNLFFFFLTFAYTTQLFLVSVFADLTPPPFTGFKCHGRVCMMPGSRFEAKWHSTDKVLNIFITDSNQLLHNLKQINHHSYEMVIVDKTFGAPSFPVWHTPGTQAAV